MTRLTPVRTRELGEDQEQREETPAPVQAKQRTIDHQVATKMMLLAIQALSQRFVVALSNLFTLLTVASAFYLWVVALPEINLLQIVSLTIYCAFILLLNIYGRRK